MATGYIEPKEGDYLQLLDSDGKLSENFTTITGGQFRLGFSQFIVNDIQGESFFVTRYPEFDDEIRHAWKETLNRIGER